MPTLNKQRVPAGGWRFPADPIRGNAYWQEAPLRFVRSHSFDELVITVTARRLMCGFPAGNPEQEITAYLCEQNPGDCGGEPTAAEPASAPTLVSRVTDWAASVGIDKMLNGVPTVDQAEAGRRALTGCIGCPQNTAVGCCGQQAQFNAVAPLLERIRGGKDVTRYGSELHACKVLGWSNRAAVWLTAENLHLPLPLPALPASCWVPSVIS